MAALALVALVGCGDDEADITFHAPETLQGRDLEIATQAALTFFEVCPNLGKWWSSVAEASLYTAEGDEIPLYRERDYGWRAEVRLRITLRDDRDRLTYGVLGTKHVTGYPPTGHTLYYNLGGGARPGVVAVKTVSQAVCGWPVQDSDLHIPLQKLALVDQLAHQ
ncbi:hypothetical protein [Roseospirillum parvum]|uniref:hypothetical protein n=1 Tax=Roseospirillum parvum TaxID=83401 RepID=UPI000B841570|nr:hypothetical protein [Roseospirillum parvum]